MKKLIKECPPASFTRLRLAAAAVPLQSRRRPESRVIFFIDTFQMRLLKARQSFSLSPLFNDDDEVVTFNHTEKEEEEEGSFHPSAILNPRAQIIASRLDVLSGLLATIPP